MAGTPKFNQNRLRLIGYTSLTLLDFWIQPNAQRNRMMKVVLTLSLFAVAAPAQWLNYPVPGVPRTSNGKPDLTARAPRLNGKPDLSGGWHVEPTSLKEMKRLYGNDVDDLSPAGMEVDTISKYAINILVDFALAESPLRPEAAAILSSRKPSSFPGNSCLPLGIPSATLVSEPIHIVQSPGLIAMLFESADSHRRIYTDGRTLPQDPEPTWLGYSIGKWEGDTLVVQTSGFNNKSWLDVMGHPHSEALHITERYHRRDFGRLDVETTFDDPKMYTRAFTIKFTYRLMADSDILEFFCNENEKDRPHDGKN
jgi:hypothetical protein